MKALQVVGQGDPSDAMRIVEVDPPTPASGQVLVRVRACALNFPDALMCRGMYQDRPALPFTPGIEVCGDVVRRGVGVDRIQLGSRVLGATVMPHGAYADMALMSASDIFAAPPQLSDAEAASLHIAFQTAWFALHVRTNLTRDDWLLVHAAAGGVGSAAVQLAKAHGARVIAVVGGPEKATVARQLGADVVIDRWERDFVPVVLEVTDGRGADVVFDPVGGSAFERSTKCIAFEGRILTIGFAAGEIPSARLNHLLVKNYSVVGLHWGAYRLRGSSRIRECYEALCDLVTSGRIRPLVSEQLVLEAVPAALSRLERGETIGRVAYVA